MRATIAAAGRSAAPVCITARAVKTGSHIVDHDAHSFGKAFQLAHRRRLHDIEPSKKYKAQQQRFPRHRHRNQGDELAGNFVDHHKLRIFQAAGPRHASGRGNSDKHGDERLSRTAVQGCHAGAIQRARSHHRRTVAAEPQVPGPGRKRPMPKNVATSVAQRSAGRDAGGTPALRRALGVAARHRLGWRQRRRLAVRHPVLTIFIAFDLAVLHRRRDHIRAAGPFPQINQAAAIAAERELGVLAGSPASCRWGTSA